MKRRTLLKGILAAAVGAPGFRLPLVNAAGHRGKFFVFVQADGGWDPTSFCDPKTNTRGEPVINHWAQYDEIREAGRIPYAPLPTTRRSSTSTTGTCWSSTAWTRRRTRTP